MNSKTTKKDVKKVRKRKAEEKGRWGEGGGVLSVTQGHLRARTTSSYVRERREREKREREERERERERQREREREREREKEREREREKREREREDKVLKKNYEGNR